jgi:hypothetical protein
MYLLLLHTSYLRPNCLRTFAAKAKKDCKSARVMTKAAKEEIERNGKAKSCACSGGDRTEGLACSGDGEKGGKNGELRKRWDA